MAQDSNSPFDEDAEASQPGGLSSGSDLQQVLDAWPQLEALIESSGRRDQLSGGVAEYISTLRAEEKTNGRVRWVAVLSIAIFLITVGIKFTG